VHPVAKAFLWYQITIQKNDIKKVYCKKKITMSTQMLITTSNALEGFKITQQLGLVRGITVRSRSILGILPVAL
jgi:hypothetical protein